MYIKTLKIAEWFLFSDILKNTKCNLMQLWLNFLICWTNYGKIKRSKVPKIDQTAKSLKVIFGVLQTMSFTLYTLSRFLHGHYMSLI